MAERTRSDSPAPDDEEEEERVSLHPLKFDEAVDALLKTSRESDEKPAEESEEVPS
jgi:hypothetical protein